MNRPRQIGTGGETAVVRYLVEHGFPYAERRALHGALDQGDIVGCPGLCFEVKSGKDAGAVGDLGTLAWLQETETERHNSRADLGILVLQRKGYGSIRVDRWWAVLPYQGLIAIGTGRRLPFEPEAVLPIFPVRLLLGDLVALLRVAGYGEQAA